MSTLTSVTEIPEGDFVDHPDEILRRVKAGEEVTLTADGKPVVDLIPHRDAAHRPRSVGWDEFWSWPKADRGMLRLLREIRAESNEEWTDPWQRYGADR